MSFKHHTTAWSILGHTCRLMCHQLQVPLIVLILLPSIHCYSFLIFSQTTYLPWNWSFHHFYTQFFHKSSSGLDCPSGFKEQLFAQQCTWWAGGYAVRHEVQDTACLSMPFRLPASLQVTMMFPQVKGQRPHPVGGQTTRLEQDTNVWGLIASSASCWIISGCY